MFYCSLEEASDTDIQSVSSARSSNSANLAPARAEEASSKRGANGGLVGSPSPAPAATVSSLFPSSGSQLSVSLSPSVRRAAGEQQPTHAPQMPPPPPAIASATAVQSHNASEQQHKLPLSVREYDAEYQLGRMILMERLLRGYPHTRALIAAEAKRDIPPLYRPYVWASLLGVQVRIYS